MATPAVPPTAIVTGLFAKQRKHASQGCEEGEWTEFGFLLTRLTLHEPNVKELKVSQTEADVHESDWRTARFDENKQKNGNALVYKWCNEFKKQL